MSDGVLLIAAGGLAREAYAVCVASGHRVLGFLDDDLAKHGRPVADLAVLGPLELVSEYPEAAVLICAGQGRVRQILCDQLSRLGVRDDRYLTVVDPAITVPPGCTIGVGSIILAGTVLTSDVSIGRHCVVMPNATLTHDDTLGDFATVCAGVALGGYVEIGEAAYLGMNSSVRQNVVVGPGAVLGMGSVLLTDLPAHQTWVGVPARRSRSAA